MIEESLGPDDLLPLVYGELRTMAHAYLSRERHRGTLQTTALVHEAYLKLQGQRRVAWRSRTHFLAVAAVQMRRILVDHARARGALRRGGGARIEALDIRVAAKAADMLDVLAVDEALNDLAAHSPRCSRVATMRLFAGMSVDEISQEVGVSPRTVKSDWRFARAWLARCLSSSP